MWISVRMRNSWELQSCGKHRGFPGGTSDKEPTRGARHVGLIPGSGRSHGGGHGNPLQYSCLANPMDSGAWQTIIHRSHRLEQDLSDFANTHGKHALLQAFSLELHQILTVRIKNSLHSVLKPRGNKQ